MGAITEGSAGGRARRWTARWLSKAGRETSSGHFIPVIDGLRFVAITSVVLYHVHTFVTRKDDPTVEADLLVRLFSTGNIGVQLFFIISGFIIGLPFAKGHFGLSASPGVSSYYLRRVTRLEPPYILSLLLLFPIAVLIIGISPLDLLPRLLASLAYLHNVIYGQMSAVNFVAWSLEIELQFYLVAPLVACIFKIPGKSGRRTLLALLMGLFSFIAYLTPDETRLGLSIVVMAQYFLAGFLLVDIYLTDWGCDPGRSALWDVVSVLSWISIYALHSLGEAGDLLVLVPMCLAYYSAFRGTWSHQLFTRRAIYTIGGMCYTIYLYHYTFTFLVGRLMERTGLFLHAPPWLRIVAISTVTLPVVLLLCTLLYVLVEKPCMNRKPQKALRQLQLG